MKLRWGVAGAGKISHDFVLALQTLPDAEHVVTAVAARDKERARTFAKQFNIQHAYGSYKELADSPEVDVVYVGTIHPTHCEIGLMMLEEGKHVLIEKPLCMNEKQAKKLIDCAETQKLFLMEGMWTRFFPAAQYVYKQIKNGAIGDVREVDATFGFPLMEVDRLQLNDLGGGTILDLGIYVISISQFALQEPPIDIKSKGKLNNEKVDLTMEASLHYSGNRIARIKTSSEEMLENVAVIKGTKGTITIPEFWCPTKIINVDGKGKDWVLPSTKWSTKFKNSAGLAYEAQEVRNCIMNGQLESEVMSHKESLLLAHISDTLRAQIGVIYASDK